MRLTSSEIGAILAEVAPQIVGEFATLQEMSSEQMAQVAGQMAQGVVLDRMLDDLWTRAGEHMASGMRKVAQDSVGMQRDLLSQGLKRVSPTAQAQMLEMAEAAAQNVVSRYMAEVPLSPRVWDNKALSRRMIDREIHQAISRGESAKQLAARVRHLINPRTPGGISYAAMRLARTEINNAFHVTTIRSTARFPWVDGYEWNLSGSHPRHDVCDELAEKDHSGLGKGVFAKENVPFKPHPQCLCYLTVQQWDEDEFLDKLTSGELDEWTPGSLPQILDPQARRQGPNILGSGPFAAWGPERSQRIEGAGRVGPSLEDAFARVYEMDELDYDSPELEEIRAGLIEDFGTVWGTRHGELNGSVTDVQSAGGEGISIEGRVVTVDGDEVGTFTRTIYSRADGNADVDHEYFTIDADYQRTGFARAFNENAENWYISQGIEKITVHADIDLGGYVWARQGFDWSTPVHARRLMQRVRREAEANRDQTSLDQIDEWTLAYERAREGGAFEDDPLHLDDPEWDVLPRPDDLAQLGRTAGAETWTGKEGMLNSDWNGTKWLRPTATDTPQAGSASAAIREARRKAARESGQKARLERGRQRQQERQETFREDIRSKAERQRLERQYNEELAAVLRMEIQEGAARHEGRPLTSKTAIRRELRKREKRAAITANQLGMPDDDERLSIGIRRELKKLKKKDFDKPDGKDKDFKKALADAEPVAFSWRAASPESFGFDANQTPLVRQYKNNAYWKKVEQSPNYREPPATVRSATGEEVMLRAAPLTQEDLLQHYGIEEYRARNRHIAMTPAEFKRFHQEITRSVISGSGWTEPIRDQILELDRAIARGRTSRDLRFYRGTAMSDSQLDAMQPGYTFNEVGYVSITASQPVGMYAANTRARQTGQRRVMMEIRTTSGTPIAIGAPEANEYILGRGWRFAVLERRDGRDPNGQPMTFLTIGLLP